MSADRKAAIELALEEVLEKRSNYPQVCANLLSKKVDLEISQLLNRKVVLPPCDKWDTDDGPILTSEQIDAEVKKAVESLVEIKVMKEEILTNLDRLVDKAQNFSRVLKQVKTETNCELYKDLNGN